MIVLGGGAVGLAQAQLWSRLGVPLTVVETLDRVAPLEEPGASAAIDTVFTDEGIAVVTGAHVTQVRRDPTGGVPHVERQSPRLGVQRGELPPRRTGHPKPPAPHA
jgi:pyruvate/2-oxoglutarate dehydrogenase complex dihydrolipoamide dehydrogenase (E3) component